ncbi:MAG: efflux RND transporter periplasmic adaptor subunit [Elusimicrobiaceae bacterium]|nr:efflux RND transporter periplasmic adaptor subunit [Elusimicrobiaceae bacterium]
MKKILAYLTYIMQFLARVWNGFKAWNWWKKSAVIVALVLLVGWLVLPLFKGRPVPPFRMARVQRGNIADIVEASGSINPVNTTQVGALVSGEILKIYVDYNTEVKKGDLMAVIDQTQILASLTEAKASLASAKEGLESAEVSYRLAKKNYERYQSLYEKDYVSKVNLEEYELSYANAKSSLNAAKASVVRAQANVDTAQKNLSNTKIVSPIDGVVLTRKVSEGQTITAGFSTPELFVVAQDLTKMQIEAKVSEADIVKIRAGQEATFTLDGYMGEKFKGTVRQVRTNYVDSSSGSSNNSTSYTVVVDVNNEDLRLKPGMTATMTIYTQHKENVLLVPNEALRFSPSTNRKTYESTGVWKAQRGQAPRRVDVTIGIIAAKNTEITSGDVQEGDMVIVGENNLKASGMGGMGNPPRMGGGRRR